VPQENVQQRLLYQRANEKVFERTVQLYDYDGRPLPGQRIRIVQRTNRDGSETVTTTTSQQDLNGRFGLLERATSQVTKSGGGRSEAKVVERRNLSGSMEVVEKVNTVEARGVAQEQQRVVTYRKGINGAFYEAARQVRERVKQPGLVTETTTEFEAGVTGRMNPTTRTVSKIRTLADKAEVRESTVYRPWTTARAARGGGLRVSEQVLVERKPGRRNTVIEKTSVRKPSLDYPYSLGKAVNVSEVICSGHCTPEQ
jgi:hypothetical protein